jgi:peptidoglycan/xylan/chitin deacetylase (PgdA/CDA1 family)
MKPEANRRDRINHIKFFIIIFLIVILLLPTILCIGFSFQLKRLQNQVEELSNIVHGEKIAKGDELGLEGPYAYAADYDSINKKTVQNPDKNNTERNNDNNLKESGMDKNGQPINQNTTEKDQNVSDKDQNTTDKVQHSTSKNNKDNKDNLNKCKDGIYQGKKVYLTFDDGPSNYTGEILDILKEYNVKATFFVIGKTDSESKKMYKRIVEEGHSLGMHSYSHDYDKLYNFAKDFEKDFTKLWKLLYDTTGYKPSIYRFPGGSIHLNDNNIKDEIISFFDEKSIVYFDWNVLSMDATGETFTVEELKNNVLNGVKEKNRSVVLMHDTNEKEKTVKSLPGLLDELVSQGAILLPLDENVQPIQQVTPGNK